jgi:hypothetical protein
VSSKRACKRIVGAAGMAVTVLTLVPHSAGAAPDSPDDVVPAVKSLGGGAMYNAGHAIFVAKDLGGGAYWLSTTTAQDGLATGVEDGREALLTVNDTVIVPIEDQLDGGG